MDNLIKIQIETEYKSTRNKLITEMKNMIDDLEHNIYILEKNEESTPNSLGVIQGYGSSIDVLCSKLSTLKTIKTILSKED